MKYFIGNFNGDPQEDKRNGSGYIINGSKYLIHFFWDLFDAYVWERYTQFCVIK